MRYMKVIAQVDVEGEASVESRIVEFYDSPEKDVVYKAKIDRFGNLQRLNADKINCEGLATLIEQFISKASRDMQRMFDWSHRGNQNGKSMELIAEGHTAEGTATSVRFRFFAEDDQMKHELLLSPETKKEKTKRLAAETQRRKEIAQEAKRRGVQPSVTQDTSFMNRLCKSYIELGW